MGGESADIAVDSDRTDSGSHDSSLGSGVERVEGGNLGDRDAALPVDDDGLPGNETDDRRDADEPPRAYGVLCHGVELSDGRSTCCAARRAGEFSPGCPPNVRTCDSSHRGSP